MSHLYLAMGARGFKLNVTSFSSPIFASLFSAQAQSMEMHFPIRAAQPELKLDVVFRNELEYEDFQKFVRGHQQRALFNPTATNVVWLNWPERNIDNWTGVIRQFKAGGERRNPAPHASFVIDLIDCMVSSRTDIASLVPTWQTIFGMGMGPDAYMHAPTQAERDYYTRVTNGDSLDPPTNSWGGTPSNNGITTGTR